MRGAIGHSSLTTNVTKDTKVTNTFFQFVFFVTFVIFVVPGLSQRGGNVRQRSDVRGLRSGTGASAGNVRLAFAMA